MDSRPLPLRVLKGLAALVVLAAIETVVPAALLAWGKGPTSFPTIAQATNALTGPDSGGLFLGAITILGWAAWALFTFQVLLELVAALRHRAAPKLPVLGAGQHLAASLIAAVVLLLPTTGTALAVTAAPASAATLHLPHAATRSPEQAAATVAAHATNRWDGPSHTVTTGDETLWALAEHYLGDGTRWKDIADLNHGIVQPDGQQLTADTLHLAPGWALRLPADATRHAPTTTRHHVDHGSSTVVQAAGSHAGSTPVHEGAAANRTVNGETTHIVRPGETLSEIAENDLGNAEDYPQIYDASTHTLQADGQHLTDPNLILPGWQLTIPESDAAPTRAVTGTPTPKQTSTTSNPSGQEHSTPLVKATGTPTAPHATAAPTASAPAPTSAPTVKAAPGSAVPAPVSTPQVPATSTSAAPTTAPTSAPSIPAPATTPAQANATATSETGNELRVGAGIAALLAAGLLGGYGVKRALQQRNRKPGETIAVPEEISTLEQVLAAQADPPTAQLLDLALRTLAAQLPDGEPMPHLEAARVGSTGVHVRADGAPLPPFVQGEDDWWTLDQAVELLSPAEAADVPPPYPLLVTIGAEPDKTLLLWNLAATRVLLLDGPPERVREVARGLVLEAATTTWGHELQILTHDLVDAGLPAMMASGRIRTLDVVAHAVTDLADLLLTAHQDPGAAQPWMFVVEEPLAETTGWDLADLVTRAPHVPVALALPSEGMEQLFPDAVHLDCASTNPSPVQHAAGPVALQRVTDAEYAILAADLATTEEPAIPAAGAWTHVAPDTTTPIPVTDVVAEEMWRTVADEPELLEDDADPGEQQEAESENVQEETEFGAAVTAFHAFAKPAATAAAIPFPGAPVAASAARPEKVHEDGVPACGQEAPSAELACDLTDLHAPELLLLGPLDVTGLGNIGRGRRLAEVAAYLYLTPGRNRDNLAEAMNPVEPWGERSVKQRLSELRGLLGNAPDGTPHLGRSTRDGQLPVLVGVHCDWHKFQKLAERGLLAGPAGVSDLERALALVRGRPFNGTTARWAMTHQQAMASRIVDTAHTVARYRIADRNYDQARAAIATGIDVQPTAELLYRDWIALEDARGSRADVQRVITLLQEMLRTLDVEMEPATETLIEAVYERDVRGSA